VAVARARRHRAHPAAYELALVLGPGTSAILFPRNFIMEPAAQQVRLRSS
jgi:hypothetical protein